MKNDKKLLREEIRKTIVVTPPGVIFANLVSQVAAKEFESKKFSKATVRRVGACSQ